MFRRDLLKGLVATGLAVPNLIPSALAQPGDEALLAHVHPDLRSIARRMLAMPAGQAPSRAALPKMRAGMARFGLKPTAEVPYERRCIAGLAGRPEVVVYVVNGGKASSRPAILHTHGGGFVMGSAEAAVAELQAICRTLDCVAVSVDYRLAPETTYAGSIEDNYAALKWLYDNAAALGVDGRRIAVMGESAGGGHAALLAIAARDRGEVPLAFQCLTYPMLDDRTGTTRLVPSHVGRLIWTPRDNRFGWESFLGTAPGERTAPRGAVAARVADLAGLPPAWIGVGSLDLFHDEDVDYAQRLNAAGVSTELIVVAGAFHGFDMPMIPAPVSRWFGVTRLTALRRGLAIS